MNKVKYRVSASIKGLLMIGSKSFTSGQIFCESDITDMEQLKVCLDKGFISILSLSVTQPFKMYEEEEEIKTHERKYNDF